MISSRFGPHAAARVASKNFGVSFCLHNDSQPTSYTSSSELSTPFRARWGVLASKLLRFRSRDDKVAARAALDRTVTHIIDHNSGLERAKRKVEGSGPAPIVVELEQTIKLIRSHSVLTPRKLTPKFSALTAQCFV